MDSFHGMEVGAEVELNDGTLEDYTSIKLENKQDLPQWQHLHHFDDSSSDESLDQYGNSIPSDGNTLKIPSQITDIKDAYVLSTTGILQAGHSFVLNNTYSKNLQEQASQLAPYLEESGISCTEVNSSSDLSQLQPYSTEPISSDEENPRQSLRKHGNSDGKPLCNRSVKLYGRDFKCQQCGRQFRRLYNLEHHLCIDMTPRCPQQNGNNIETMNRLEKMCVEAQKELQSLQGQYKKEVVDSQPSSSEIQLWSQQLLSGSEVIPANKCTFPCDLHEFESSSVCSEEFHISSEKNSKSFAPHNLPAGGNTIVVDLPNCSPLFLETNQKQGLAKQTEDIHPLLDQRSGRLTNLNQPLSFQTSLENLVDTTNTNDGVKGMDTNEATTFYKCQEYGENYSACSSITNHLHWAKKMFISSVVSTQVEPSLGGQESYGTTHNVSTPPLSLNNVSGAKPTQTFACEYCGKEFNRRCSYATHVLWHLRKKEPVTVIPTQETGPVSSLPTKNQNGNRARTSPAEIFTCQSCGRVFNKRCAYINHSHWHVKEQELQKRIIAEAQKIRLNEERLRKGNTQTTLAHDNMIFYVDPNKEVSDACLDDGNVQGYCRLVRQLSLEEQHNLSSHEQLARKSVEPSHPLLPMPTEIIQQTLPEVLESVLELVVGTEEVHEILLSKAGLVFRKAEEYDDAEGVPEDASETRPKPEEEANPGTQSEPEEKPVPALHSEPAEEQIPGTYWEPEQKPVPGTWLEPAEEQILGKQKNQNTLQILPTKLTGLRLMRTKPPHRCRDCGIRFQQLWRLKNHRHKGFGKMRTLQKHQCDCGRTPIGSLHFLLHQLQHLSDTAFVCAVCSKSLRGYRQLQAHSWVHPLVSQFQCKCGARFTKLPKYLWHSLKNKAKPKAKLQLRACTGAPFK